MKLSPLALRAFAYSLRGNKLWIGHIRRLLHNSGLLSLFRLFLSRLSVLRFILRLFVSFCLCPSVWNCFAGGSFKRAGCLGLA